MLRMRACACGLRTNAAWVVKGTFRSSTKLPLPVTSRGSSRRLMLLPKSVSPMMSPRLRGLLHRLHDVGVPGAAADVALEPGADLGLARIGVALEQVAGGDDHARRAEAALQAV